MNKKAGFAFLTATALFTSGVIPTASFASEINTESQVVQTVEEESALSLEQLYADYQISDATMEGLVRTVTYEKNGEKHIVVYNAESGNVTIDGVIQEGLTYEYDPNKALLVNNPNTSNSGITTYAAAAKTGYKYVGTMSGHTKEAKDAAQLALTLAGIIPGVGWGAGSVLIVTGYVAGQRIPSLYYTYDLYQKGFMTESWYQYSTTRMYKDSAHKKPTGKAWTSKAEKIYLPNS